MKAYVTTAIGKGGEAVEKAANTVCETCTEWWNKLFKKADAIPDTPAS